MINGAPLPGQALVVLDPQRQPVEDMYPDACGHTQERLILNDLINDLQPGLIWFGLPITIFARAFFYLRTRLNQFQRFYVSTFNAESEAR